jgi:hypothetical protein
MASLRERYKVWWDDGEPVEVTTTAKDLITAVDVLPEAQRQNGVAITSAQLYCTLVRQGHKLGTIDEWLLVLDGYEKIALMVEVEGPTKAAPLLTGQSWSLASQEPNGSPGLTTTTAP